MSAEDVLYVHVTGTDQTTTLSREAVRAAVAQGQMKHSQLIWSPAANAWKPVREMPDLLPDPTAPAPHQVAPPPAPRVAMKAAVPAVAAARPQVVRAQVPQAAVQTTVPQVAQTQTPQAAVKVPVVQAVHVPARRVSVSAAARAGARTGKSVVVDEADDDSHLLRWLCIVPGLVIAALVGLNYFLVDAPLAAALGQTAFAKTTVYAHLGAFVQPNALVIHIPPSSAVTTDNVTDFLVALARSTPSTPVGHGSFDRVALSNGMSSRYSFSGSDWKQLGDMDSESPARVKAFILEEADDASGVSIVPPPVKVAGKYVDQREKAWSAFISYFASPS